MSEGFRVELCDAVRLSNALMQNLLDTASLTLKVLV
jgi:hypothetical protein